jgi:hypothetical protein
MNNTVVGDIYKYVSPALGFATIELKTLVERTRSWLPRTSTTLVSFPGRPSKTSLARTLKKQKGQNGRPVYLYQFQGRTVSVLVDSANNVYSIGTW